MKIYDYEKLLKRFPKMSDGEARCQFAKVHNMKKNLDLSLECGFITEDEYFCYIEPLDMAYQYLSGYLAISNLLEHGYDFNCFDLLVKRCNEKKSDVGGHQWVAPR